MTDEKKCAIFLANGFEECEGLIVVDLLRRAGVPITTVSMSDNLSVISSHGITLQADSLWRDFEEENFEALILPGGKVGTENLDACDALKEVLKKHCEEGKLTCAICAAPSVLGNIGLLKGKHYTCFPSFYSKDYEGIYEMELAVRDGNIITGRGMGATIEFAREILKCLISEEALKQTEFGIQYEHSFRELTKKPE